MSETRAHMVAAGLHGEAHHSGGGIWIVVITTPDARCVVISEDMIAEYPDRRAFEDGRGTKIIDLN